MALQRSIAIGTERCHKCGRLIKQGSLKVKRPSKKAHVPGTFMEGSNSYVWVHEGCSPTKTGKHGTGAKKR